ncbi:DUF4339 domain-containing protein [Burkholderia multivorans]|uniref:DUF4339 domain-containing protein n=1 Tax=Burkholderia multivorans TaxID=87883 RepID=UPI000CFFF79A|nr:DUF4339 domain-containing protein [Burkholderia multivorans]MBU9185201.1 DUF4339 domain-containing protein [Burkholderia multivorans]MCA8245564.1 DUF4339 domain-containing protein [Burkholderia multivorans]PRE23717.1 DUF4339 domain-containing protein [Burkholderia multivorans]
MNTWHYEKDGRRLGPVSNDEMRRLIQERVLSLGTLVWKQGFTDWRTLADTELASHLETSSIPPALPTTKISNAIVWILALAPMIGLMLQAMIAGAQAPSEYMAEYAAQAAVKSGQYWWITLLLNIGLSLLDERRLKRAGVDTAKFGSMALVVPVYLWKRAKSLNQSPAYFWTWIVLFVIALIEAA